jgi:signal transduction histidine kinase/CheY-like chemotaxis protein
MSLARRAASGSRTAPWLVLAAVLILLAAGAGVVLQNEAAYRAQKTEEVRVQAEILAASVAAALDFGDAAAAQEAVDALRVNRQVRQVTVTDAGGRMVAGFQRGADEFEEAAQAAAPRGVRAEVPVLSGGSRIGAVALAADAEPLASRVARYLVIGLLVLLAMLLVGLFGLAQNAVRRANRELEARAAALGAANAELQVQMTERARAEEQLRQAHKMQALGQLTGGIAHDFNNLLTVIQGSADMLRRPELKEEKRLRYAEAVVQAAARAAALTSQLLAFARRQPLDPVAIEVNALIEGMRDLLDRTLGERVMVEVELASGGCTVEADRAQLESALLNIAVNARDAMGEGGRLTIRTANEEGGMVAIAISDTGAGMDEDTLARAFEPFFTTKGSGKGTGLGLSQVYGFASQSGGDVRIASRIGVGTTVTILLPCSERKPSMAAPGGPGRLPEGRRGAILLVEDNEDVATFAEGLLGELGHKVTRAGSGAAALELLEGGLEVDLLFTDVVMPGMSGLELADAVARRRPGLPVLLTTGYSDEIAASGTGGRPVILKPYRLETLAAAIAAELGG